MGSHESGRAASLARPVGGAIIAAAIGAGSLVLILGVLASTAGTFAVSGLAGLAIGILIAGASVPTRGDKPSRAPAPPVTRARLRRDQATKLAMVIAGGMILTAGVGVWLFGRAEGGVMDPVSYLWTTFGFGLPAQAVVALLASAWGAANGPIRWNS